MALKNPLKDFDTKTVDVLTTEIENNPTHLMFRFPEFTSWDEMKKSVKTGGNAYRTATTPKKTPFLHSLVTGD